MGYLPSEGESLKGYCERLRSIAQQNRYSYAPTHEKWYTHYGPNSCFICNFMDMCDYLISAMDDIWQNDKTHVWLCFKGDISSKDPMTFEFKPHKR